MTDSTSRRRKITLNDVAHAANVSRATVSLVLRDSPLVHADTRAKVEKQMSRLGYVYNRAAADLRRQVSSSVALVINDLSNPFFAEFAAGVDEALAEAGYVTLLGCSNESTARQEALMGSLIELHPAAIILSPAEGTQAKSLVNKIGTRTPVLVFNRELADSNWDFLGLDNRNGARLATAHLLELGHRHIAFFGGHADSSSCRERREGYRDALKHAGIVPSQKWMLECAPTRFNAAHHADALFALDPTPTAAVCYNDAVALGLMLGLARLGRRAGQDFAVTGFDDIAEAALSTPPLTTLAAVPRARGRQAAMLVLAHTQQAQTAARTIAPVQLVVRESSAVRID